VTGPARSDRGVIEAEVEVAIEFGTGRTASGRRGTYPIDDHLHARVRALAALRGVTLRDLIAELLEDAVEEANIPDPMPVGQGGSQREVAWPAIYGRR
jgi:hypothetical protein